MLLYRFFRSKQKNISSCSGVNTTSENVTEATDESKKKIIVKKDLVKLKWKHIKPKRGYRNGIYPKWSRLRGKVYKSTRNTFQNTFIQSIDKIRTNVSTAPVHPVHLTRSRSSSTVLPLRPPNGHDH